MVTWSYYYLDTEPDFRRFSSLIFLFLVSMFSLVLAGNLLSLFVAWDLLGFRSFFLVVFFRSRSSLSGGLLTGLTNRLGDVFLLVAFGFLCRNLLSWAVYLLIVVGCTKSAQVPFRSWLPAAMLAPTPVSALVHSSTLVTAGVYLFYRFLPLPRIYLVYVGVLTTLVSGYAALLECDLKKIVALSTLSQLGLIITTLGLGERALCFSHLNTHASFKALLFICLGSLIHSVFGNQEARSYGSLVSHSPLLYVLTLVCLLSMCGLVFTSGWATKEAILDACIGRRLPYLVLVLFYIGIILTLGYRLCLGRHLSVSVSLPRSLVCSFVASETIKGPMCWLLVLSVLQGYGFARFSYWPTTFVRALDTLLIWLLLLLTFFLREVLGSTSLFKPSHLVCLGTTTSCLPAFRPLVSNLVYTEVSGLHGAGLGSWSRVLTAAFPGKHLLYKVLVSLGLVLVII